MPAHVAVPLQPAAPEHLQLLRQLARHVRQLQPAPHICCWTLPPFWCTDNFLFYHRTCSCWVSLPAISSTDFSAFFLSDR